MTLQFVPQGYVPRPVVKVAANDEKAKHPMKLILLLAFLLAGCGGGSEPLHDVNTLPVRCTVAGVSGTCT